MPLTIRLKPDEKIIIGGAVIKNGKHSSELHVENQVPILRRKDIMTESEAITPARQIYFELQLIYIDVERRDIHSSALATLLETSDFSVGEAHCLTQKILAFVSAKDFYHAMKSARELILLEDAHSTTF